MEILEKLIYHTTLANYFCCKQLFFDIDQPTRPNVRKLVEQPWQQIMAKQNEALCQTLTSLKFIQAICSATMVDNLLQNYFIAIKLFEDEQLNSVIDCRNFILENAVFLRNNPNTCIQLAILEDQNSAIGKSARIIASESSIVCLEPVRFDSSKSYNYYLCLKEHRDQIKSLAYNTDNESLISCDENEIIHWNLNSGAITSWLTLSVGFYHHGGPGIAKNGKTISVGNGLRDVKTGHEIVSYITRQKENEYVKRSIISADSSVVALLSETAVDYYEGFHHYYYIRTISSKSGEIILDLKFVNKVIDATFSPDSNLLAIMQLGPTPDSVGSFNTLTVWDLGKNIKIYEQEHNLKVDHISFSKDGNVMYGQDFNDLFAFNVSDWSLRFTIHNSGESIIDILPVNDIYLLAWGRHSLNIWNTKTESKEHCLLLNSWDWITSVAYSDNRMEFAIGFLNGKIELIKLEDILVGLNEEKPSSYSYNSITNNGLLFSPDNQRIAVAFNRYEFKILDVKSNTLIVSRILTNSKLRTDYTQIQESQSDEIRSFSFTNDGKSIILISLTHIVDKNSPKGEPGFGPKPVPYGTVRRVSSGDLIDQAVFMSKNYQSLGSCITPDDYAVLVKFDHRNFLQLLSNNLVLIKEFIQDGGNLILSPDGSHLLSGKDIKSLVRNKTIFSSTKSSFDKSVFSPDGILAPSVNDSKIDLINISDLSEITSIDLGYIADSEVNSLLFSPDGRKLLIFRRQSATTPKKSRMQSAILWNIRGSKLNILERSNVIDFETSFKFSPDGSLVYGFEKIYINVWNADSGVLVTLLPLKKIDAFDCSRDGSLMCIAQYGRLEFFHTLNILKGPPVITAKRVFQFKTKTWQKEITAVCPHCGQSFVIQPSIQDTIQSLNKDSNPGPNDSPCLKLTDKAWDAPELLDKCPRCDGKLKFNPFIAGNNLTKPNWQFWKS